MDSQTSQEVPPPTHTHPPGPRHGLHETSRAAGAAAAGLNKYVAEGTCWQLGPRYGRRCLCCGFTRGQRRKQLGRHGAFPG